MNSDTTTIRALDGAMVVEDDTSPAQNLRKIAAQIQRLADEVERGVAKPCDGAGWVVRDTENKAWVIDLEMTFDITDEVH